MSSHVIDSSALLALLQNEPGAAVVREALAAESAAGSVNLAEVATKLTEHGASRDEIELMLARFALIVVDFDADLAIDTGLLRTATRASGLSLGDRACLALAFRLGLPVLTADRAWQHVQVGVTINVIR